MRPWIVWSIGLLAYVVAILMAIAAFFLIVLNFEARPFVSSMSVQGAPIHWVADHRKHCGSSRTGSTSGRFP